MRYLLLFLALVLGCTQNGIRRGDDAGTGYDAQPEASPQEGGGEASGEIPAGEVSGEVAGEVKGEIGGDAGRPLGAACSSAGECGSGYCVGAPGRCCDKPCDGSCVSCGTGYCENVADDTKCGAESCSADGQYANSARCEAGACVTKTDDCFLQRACGGAGCGTSATVGYVCLLAWGTGVRCVIGPVGSVEPAGCFDTKICPVGQICYGAGLCGLPDAGTGG